MNFDNHLTGLLLGDGFLELHKNGKNACFRLNRCSRDRSYIEFTSNILEKHISPAGITEHSVYDNRTNKTYNGVRLRTRVSTTFTEMHKKWYVNRFKIVPRDLNLNEEIIATWFADDGSVAIQKSKYDVKLATHGFSHDDVEFLRNQLNNKFDLDVKSYLDDGHSVLRIINKEHVKKFVDLIDKPFSELSMDRKSEIWRKNYNLLVPVIKPPCKWCSSIKVYRNGHLKNKQTYHCQDCDRQWRV